MNGVALIYIEMLKILSNNVSDSLLISHVFDIISYFVVLEVEAFERLLGPCMDIMKRNIDDYETQLIKIFGSKNNISDIR